MSSRKFFWFFGIVLVFFSCQKKTEAPSPQRGEITIITDDAFKNVTEALTERYMALYPETKINVVHKKEDVAFMDLLRKTAHVIVMSRSLSQKEVSLFEQQVDLPIQPANFAADAVVFVVPKTDPRESISLEEIKYFLTQENDKTLIFDGYNTANLNFVLQKLNLSSNHQNLNFGTIPKNHQIIKQLPYFKNKIGVVSLNTISRPYSEQIAQLRSAIKILPVIDEKGDAHSPDLENIKNMKYPFARILYFLTNEGFFGLSNGFIRFSCTQLGQIVVSKQGLQPYNYYKREVQMR